MFDVNEPRQLTVGSLFAGIGGFDLGLERAGMRVIWQCEKDDRKRVVLRKHWPHALQISDVAEARGYELPHVDVLAGGFPCQDISNAGRRAGIDGQQSGLWSEFWRLICEIRPRYALVENVPAVLVRGMGRIVGDLADCGYDAEWDCIPAAAIGAPHLRARIWILAYASRHRDEEGPVHTIFAGRPEFVIRHRWAPEPSTSRVDNGVPGWIPNAAGDALVPQIAEIIGRAIVEHANR